jgi:hypothetical protein
MPQSRNRIHILHYTSDYEASEPRTPPSLRLDYGPRRTAASDESQGAGRHNAGSLTQVLMKMPLDMLYEVSQPIFCASRSCQCHNLIHHLPVTDILPPSSLRYSTLSSDFAGTSGSTDEPFIAVSLEICVFQCARFALLPIGINITPICQPRL